jgi:hypothetical protein
VQGGRVFVAGDSQAPGRPVTFRVFDLGGSPTPTPESFSTEGAGNALMTDVAFQKDRAIFAIEQAGSMTLVAYDQATTSPVFLREVFLPRDPRVPTLKNVRDGNMAMAASDTRVAVVWTTAKQLTEHDVLGGYAVFACSTP